MSTLKKILAFLDDNILFFFGLFLICFIPLYPKIPLADILPGYIVRLRLEDIFVGAAAVFWLIWLIRGKIKLDFPLWKLVAIYLGIGVLSIITNILFTHWIPFEPVHVGKSVLHLLRYTEYFFLGFLLYSGCKKKWHFQVIVAAIFITLLAVCVYGWGQRYLYWPVFSTMNREFSKGMVLYLTEHARVQSTFAGHYDFAAWLLVMLPLTFALSLKQKNWFLKLGGLAIHFFGLWGMIVAASRTSFAALPVCILFILIVYAVWAEGSIWRKLGRFFGWGIFYFICASPIILFFGDDLVERLEQPFNHIDFVRYNYEAFRDWRLNGSKLTDLLGIKQPENGVAVSLEDQEVVVTPPVVPSDSTPVTAKPQDVYVDVPEEIIIATETATGTTYTVESRDRTYSMAALKYGLSLGIRLDTLWPMAWQGFLRNPLFGSGYGTLNKTGAVQFTEADSTDNNFLRTLGETGLLGFLAFYGLLILAMIQAARAFKNQQHPLYRFFALGLFAGIIGLLINAVYIDVFAASKVAFTIWALIGVLYAMSKFYTNFDQSIVHLATSLKNKQTAQERAAAAEVAAALEKNGGEVESLQVPVKTSAFTTSSTSSKNKKKKKSKK